MKTFLALIALTAWSCMASSQNLTPKVQQQGNDTLFCFTLSQSRNIAKTLEQGRYCDSLLLQTEQQSRQLSDLLFISDSSLQVSQNKITNQEVMLRNNKTELAMVNLNLQQTEKKYKSERWQKYLFMVATVSLGTWLIVK